MKGSQGNVYYLITAAILMPFVLPSDVSSNEISITIATIPNSSPAFRTDGKNVLKENPGYRAELLYQAGKHCNVNIKFSLLPWNRVLNLVKNDVIEAAFSSSYKPERAVYGAYPMKDGKPDTDRAVKKYAYTLFTHKDSGIAFNGKAITGENPVLVVERGSIGIDIMKSFGLEPRQLANQEEMIKLLVNKRIDGIIAIEHNIESEVSRHPDFTSKIKKHQPPILTNYGYVMFSKRFYYRNTLLVECMWDSIGKIRSSLEYKELINFYNNNPEFR